jgi:hypothetical protein
VDRGNWLSLAACVVLPLPAIARLGQAYGAYESHRARIIPRLW